MNFKIVKSGNIINFIDASTDNKFDYINFVDKLYQGEKLEIIDYGNATEDEKRAINQTINELNDLSNPRKRKRIIAELDSN